MKQWERIWSGLEKKQEFQKGNWQKEIGMDRASYSKFESGQRGISLGNFYAFSQFFNVSMDELLKD